MPINSDTTIVTFESLPPVDGSTTQAVSVKARRGGAELGTIRWDLRWRQYALLPAPGARFTHRCLSEVTAYLIALMDAWALEKGKAPRGAAPKFNAGLQHPKAQARRQKRDKQITT